MIQNMKPDRIQIVPPIDTGDLPWMEKAPSLTRSFDFDKVRDAALFMIYADELAGESDEIRVTQNLIGRTVTLTAKPASADYLTHAVYEFAAMVDAAIEALRRRRGDHEELACDELACDELED